MKTEIEINEILDSLQHEYEAITFDIINKCSCKEDYCDEYMAQCKIFAQIEMLNFILHE